MQHCEENSIPFALILGDSELERGIVKLREVSTREEHELSRDNLTNEIKSRLATLKL